MKTRLAIGIDPGSGKHSPNLGMACLVDGEVSQLNGFETTGFGVEDFKNFKNNFGYLFFDMLLDELTRGKKKKEELHTVIGIEDPFVYRNVKTTKELVRYGEFLKSVILSVFCDYPGKYHKRHTTVTIYEPLIVRPSPKTWQKFCFSKGNLRSIEAKAKSMKFAQDKSHSSEEFMTQDIADAICVACYADAQLQEAMVKHE